MGEGLREHVNFGMVSMEEGTLSTRHGNVVYLEDVLDAAVEKTGKIIEEKSPDLPDKDEVAAAVGVGAVVWSMLYNSRIKDVTFSWKKVLNFDGETGPYAQYTHARCCSVLRKAGSYDVNAIDPSCFADDATASLAKAIAAFPSAVLAAAEKNEPYIVSRATMEVCTAFNKFYFCNQIITEDAGVSAARLALTDAARITIKKGLYLVDLQAPERMSGRAQREAKTEKNSHKWRYAIYAKAYLLGGKKNAGYKTHSSESRGAGGSHAQAPQ